MVNEEVKKLLENRMIREVQYPEWLANLVVVSKKNGKMRVYIDFKKFKQGMPKG